MIEFELDQMAELREKLTSLEIENKELRDRNEICSRQISKLRSRVNELEELPQLIEFLDEEQAQELGFESETEKLWDKHMAAWMLEQLQQNTLDIAALSKSDIAAQIN